MRHNNRTWFALLMLTLLGFFASDYSGQSVVLIILAASAAKCAALAWRFMELRRAHWVWTLGLFSLLAAFLGAGGLLLTW